MTDTPVGKALADLRKLQKELSDIIETLAKDSPGAEVVYEDLFTLIVKELQEHGPMLDYELIEKLQKYAREGRVGQESTVWVAIESNVRHGNLIAKPELKERTNKMKDRKETPTLKDRYYGHRISLPPK